MPGTEADRSEVAMSEDELRLCIHGSGEKAVKERTARSRPGHQSRLTVA